VTKGDKIDKGTLRLYRETHPSPPGKGQGVCSDFVHRGFHDVLFKKKHRFFKRGVINGFLKLSAMSLLDQIGFFWFDSFAWTGWRRLLTRDDLWSLQLANRFVPILAPDRIYKSGGKERQSFELNTKKFSLHSFVNVKFSSESYFCNVVRIDTIANL
jgi:hypothetical protein